MEVEEPLALEAARNYRAVELQVLNHEDCTGTVTGAMGREDLFHQFPPGSTDPWDERYICTDL